MQSKGFAAIVLALFVAALVVVSCVDEINDKYLPAPYFAASYLHGTVLTMIQKNQPESPNPNDLIKVFKTIAENSKDCEEQDFYEELAHLNEPDGVCTPSLIRYIYAILALAKEEPKMQQLQPYVAYLKSIGKTKLGQCAQKTDEEFQRVKGRLMQEDEKALDEFFMAYVNAKRNLDSQDLYEAANKMDLSVDDYKVRRMLKVSREYMRILELDDERVKSFDQLSTFIMGKCALLQGRLGHVFAVFNLARALGAQTNTGVEVRFLKLNEYNRVCLTWQKNRVKAEANLRRQLKATKWYKIGGVLSKSGEGQANPEE